MQKRPSGKLVLLVLAEALLCLATGTLVAQDVRYN